MEEVWAHPVTLTLPVPPAEGPPVSRRTRLSLLPAALVVTAVALTGCGGDSSSSAAASGDALGVESVDVSGAVGSDPTVKFSGKVTDPTSSTKVLVQGSGAEVAKGDAVLLQSVIADGYTQKTVASSYKDHQPQVVTLSDQVSPIFLDALVGKTVGSRVLVYASADKIFGPSGNTSLGISNKDVVLLVFDIVSKPLAQPDGKSHPEPGWAPKIEKTKGVVSGLDFKGTPKPNGELRSATLQDGTGDVVKKGQTIVVRYLGQVYDGKQPFDENFSKDLTSFPIGAGRVIKGWDKTLVGQKVGSEVILAIPPSEGYGKGGQSSAGIKGTDTLYFVVDILGAA
jgi:peptidylprolyl isomerase